MVTYNLKDVSREEAIAKGEIFFSCWQEFMEKNSEKDVPVNFMFGLTRKQRVLESAFWKCNRIGENVDILDVLWSYKTLFAASGEESFAMYCYIADRMGLTNEEMCTKEKYDLLVSSGYLASAD